MQNPYDDGDGTEVSTDNKAQVSNNDTGADDEKENSEGAKTAVIPQEVCPGMSVGDMIPLKVTRVNEGDYECEYVKDEHSDEEEPASDPAPAEGSMQSMMD